MAHRARPARGVLLGVFFFLSELCVALKGALVCVERAACAKAAAPRVLHAAGRC